MPYVLVAQIVRWSDNLPTSDGSHDTGTPRNYRQLAFNVCMLPKQASHVALSDAGPHYVVTCNVTLNWQNSKTVAVTM
jgi:hypothetical protein